MRAAVAMGEFKPRNGATYTVTGAPVVVVGLDRVDRELDARAARRRAARHGRDARARLPRPSAAAAAGDRARRRGGDVRRAVARRRVADDGLDRRAAGADRPRGRLRDPVAVAHPRGAAGSGERWASPAARRAALLGAPAVAVAAAATAAGFAVLAFSPVPMVRGFGLLLVAGIVIAFALALLAGTRRARRSPSARRRRRGSRACGAQRGAAARERRRPPPARWRARRRARRAGAPAARRAPAPPGAARASTAARPGRCGAAHCSPRDAARARLRRPRPRRAALAYAIARPARVLAIALAVAACGWALDTQTRVESDIQRLVPQDMPALRDLDALQRSTGVGGEIDVVVEGADLTSPRVIAWMTDFQSAVLEEHGFSADARLRPGRAVPRVLAARPLHDRCLAPRRGRHRRRCWTPCRRTSRSSVISADRRTATLAFGIRLMALDEQKRVIDAMRARLDDDRPPGVRAAARRPAGARRRRQRRRLLDRAPPADAARRPARGGARPARRVPRPRARARAARADRAGDRLVGARPVLPCASR